MNNKMDPWGNVTSPDSMQCMGIDPLDIKNCSSVTFEPSDFEYVDVVANGTRWRALHRGALRNMGLPVLVKGSEHVIDPGALSADATRSQRERVLRTNWHFLMLRSHPTKFIPSNHEAW